MVKGNTRTKWMDKIVGFVLERAEGVRSNTFKKCRCLMKGRPSHAINEINGCEGPGSPKTVLTDYSLRGADVV